MYSGDTQDNPPPAINLDSHYDQAGHAQRNGLVALERSLVEIFSYRNGRRMGLYPVVVEEILSLDILCYLVILCVMVRASG